MDDFGFLIPLLMFAIPLAAALLDKKNKAAKQGSKGVQAHPLTEEEIRRILNADGKEEEGEEESDNESEPLQAAEVSAAGTGVPFEEGQKAIRRPHLEDAPKEEEKKLEIDRKKLVIYSEIMKPKFDA